MKRSSNDLSSSGLSPTNKDQALGEAIAEYLSSFDTGHKFDADAWCEQHPTLANPFRDFLRDHHQVNQLLSAQKLVTHVASASDDVQANESTNKIDSSTPMANDTDHSVPEIAQPTVLESAIDKEFGDYFILGQLGQGGMGTVFAAVHRDIGRVVALKIVRNSAKPGTVERARFQREVESISRLDHPNVIPIYDYGTVGDLPYFTMKQVTSGTLNERRNVNQNNEGNQPPWKWIAKIIAQLASGLQHAHDRGILHRDLKPSNVLLDEQDIPYIADFGLAKCLDGFDTASGIALGTPAYMAPEQAKGDATVQTDLFSLGAVMYYLLTGKPPVQTNSWTDWLRNADNWKPQSPREACPDVPVDLAAICLKCLNREPALRYASARQLADDLQRWLQGEPTEARNPSSATRFWFWCKRHPLVASLSAALLATMLASTATITMLYLRSETLRGKAIENLGLANEAAAAATLQRNRLRQALQDMTADVTTEWLFAFDEFTASQRQFLTNASDYYREFVTESEGNSEDLLWVADAEHRLAQLLKRLGKADEAMASIVKGLEILDRLPATFEPERVNLKRLELLVERQSWLADAGKIKDALEVTQAAAKLAEELPSVSILRDDVRLRIGQLRIDEARWLRKMYRLQEALVACESAVQWNQELAASLHQNSNARRQHGLSWFYMAMCQMSMRKYDEAAISFEKGAEIQLELAEADPNSWIHYADYCYTLDNLGVMYGSQNQWNKAIEYIQQASESRRTQLQKFPQADTLRRAQGQSLINLASMLSRVERWPERRKTLEECRELAETGMQQASQVVDYELFFWIAEFGLVDDLIRLHDSEAAIAILDKSIPRLKSSVQANPMNERLKQQLERAYFYRAEQQSLISQFDRSLEDWESAIELAEGLAQSNLRLRRIITLARRNQQEDWSGELQEINEIITHQMSLPAKIRYPDLFYNSACFHAILATNASTAQERQAHQETAINYLKQAKEFGWSDSVRLNSDSDLSSLRELPDFEDL